MADPETDLIARIDAWDRRSWKLATGRRKGSDADVAAAMYQGSLLKRQLWLLRHPGRLRCCECGAFLASAPDEERYSDADDNIDIYQCRRCGAEREECY